MSMIPLFLFMWLSGLISTVFLGGGAYLLYTWYVQSRVFDPDLGRTVFDTGIAFGAPVIFLVAGGLLLLWTFAGHLVVRAIGRLVTRRNPANDEHRDRGEGTVRRLKRPDGSELHVELFGPPDAPPIVLTHGWGLSGKEWQYLRHTLVDRFRLIIWDLPGLGQSSRPKNRDYSLENLARDLDAVLELAGGRKAILLGHSIGGMITLTFCRLFLESLDSRVAGIALVHTTHTDPVRTVIFSGVLTAIEKPFIVPLMYLTIGLSPLVWIMNWLSYLNGTTDLITRLFGFSGTESWEQVELTSRLQPRASPAVLARGMLGMMKYDATRALARIDVPTLVVPGDRDPVCRPEASEFISEEVPGARIAPLHPAKHMGLMEHNRQFSEIVSEFALQSTRASA